MLHYDMTAKIASKNGVKKVIQLSDCSLPNVTKLIPRKRLQYLRKH